MRSVPPFVLSVEQPEHSRQHNADNDARNQGEVECTAIAHDDDVARKSSETDTGQEWPRDPDDKPINKRWASIAGTSAQDVGS
jgi:hypothetical protein